MTSQAQSNIPRRFLNVHWLNPAYLIPLVEISPGKATDPADHRTSENPARRHRQGAGGVRGDAGLHRAAHPGAGDERGGTDGGRRRRQRRGYRQGDPLRFWLPLRGAGPAGIHRLGRRRYSLLRQPLSRGRARQRPLSRAGGDFAQHARRPDRPADRRRLSRLFRPRRRRLSRAAPRGAGRPAPAFRSGAAAGAGQD